MTATEIFEIEERLRDLEEHRVDHPLSDETLRQLRAWWEGVKRRERGKIVDIDEYRRWRYPS